MDPTYSICTCPLGKHSPSHKAKLRTTKNSAWLRLELVKKTVAVSGISILIDTGAGVSLIRRDIVDQWKALDASAVKEEQGGLRAETCDGSLLEISGRVTISPCRLSGGPSLSLSFYIAPSLFCKSILGLPELTNRNATLQFGASAYVEYHLLPGDPQLEISSSSKVTQALNHIVPITRTVEVTPLGSMQVPCVGYIKTRLSKSNLTLQPPSLMVTKMTRCGQRLFLTIFNPTSQPIPMSS